MNDAVSIAILAGGQSSRMAQDKSFVKLADKPLIAHVIEHVQALDLPIMIIANQPEAYQVFGLPVLTDILPNRSSLAGLYSAIYHSPSEYTLCVACDMPFLNPNLLNYLISLCTNNDAAVPIIGGHPQGLLAVYRKTCLAPMRQQLEQNRLKVRDLYTLLRTCWIEETSLRQYDSDLNSFVNVNTPEVLQSVNSTPRLKD